MPDVINSGLALFFAWLFAVAGVHKLRTPGYYVDLMSSYLPSLSSSSALFIRLVAAMELSIAALLLLPQSRVVGLLACAVLLSIYAISMVLQIKRGMNDMACGCAGPASTLTVSPALVVRNLLCAVLALFALGGSATVAAGLTGYALTAFIASFMIVGYLCSDQLIANAQQMAGEK